MPDTIPTGLILAGGLALAAYQRGVIEALLGSRRIELRAVAGTSMGAINGAILLGNPPDKRIERLGAFWDELVSDPTRQWVDPLRLGDRSSARHGLNWLNVAAVRLGGNAALFRPRGLLETHPSHVPSLYMPDRTPETLARYIDFDRLNGSEIRFCCVATDIESGECLVFDTARGDRIELEHILGSASQLPAFPPTPVGGRLLADGEFGANAPLEPLLASDRIGEPLPLCVLADLFSAQGAPPRKLEKAIERAMDLKYAGQTEMRLAGLLRERGLEAQVPGRDKLPGTDLVFLRYQAPPDESGSEKPYDFSRASLAERREQGRTAMQRALANLPEVAGAPGLRVHRP
jgi:NTE family protein